MAVAIREARPIRGVMAVAERPDGTRSLFTPYPTPIVDADGKVVGAVNLLIDVTDERQACALGRPGDALPPARSVVGRCAHRRDADRDGGGI